MALFKIFRRKQHSGDKSCRRSKDQCPKLIAADIWEPSRVHLPPPRLIIYRENEWKERRLLYDSNLLASGSTKKSPTKLNASPLANRRETSPLNSSKSMPFSMDEEEPANTSHAISDAKSIAEMMFGSIGMYSKGHVIKLHELKNPAQIMLTHIFQLSPKSGRSSQPVIRENIVYETSAFSNDCPINESDSDSQYSTINSMDSFLIITNQRRRSCNVRIPRSCSSQEQSRNVVGRSRTVQLSCSPENGGSQESAQDRSAAGTPSTPTPITASWKSLQLSYMINSFENLNQRRHSHATGGLSDEDDVSANVNYGKRTQIGVAVVFSKNRWDVNDENFELFRRFLFSHLFVIESEIAYLTERVAKNCYGKKQDFLMATTQAWSELCTSLRILYESPRLSSPIWYSLTFWNDELSESKSNVSSKVEKSTCNVESASNVRPNSNSTFSSKFETTPTTTNRYFRPTGQSDESVFVNTLYDLASTLDTKETNFFLSTALTTFLALHSGWVASVAPPSLPSLSTLAGQTKSSFKDFKKTSYRETIRSNVNVFVAQLLDLWSVFNSDHHSLRTLFIGFNNDLLAKLVLVFSYFLRCNSLKKSTRFISNCSKNRRIDSTSDQFSQVDNRNLGEEQIFNIKNDINYGGNYGLSCNLTDYLYNKMACLSEEHLAEKCENSPMEVDEKLDENLGPDERLLQHTDMPETSDPPGEPAETSGVPVINVSSKSDLDHTVQNLFSSAKIEHLTQEHDYPVIFETQSDQGVRNIVSDQPRFAIDLDQATSQDPSSVRDVDLNNNRQTIWRRFDDPGLSLQTCLQRLGPAESHLSHLAVEASNPCAQLNANFALSAVLVQPASDHGRKQSLVRSPRSGISAHNGHHGGSQQAPRTDEQVIMEALVRTADQCDPAYVSTIDFLVADCRDWSVKVLSCDVADSMNDIDREMYERKSPRISENNCLPARSVLDMLENVKLLYSTNAEPEFILVHIEDWLTDLYHKGTAFASLIGDPHSDPANKIVPLEALSVVGADPSDASLLFSVCAF